MGLGGSRGVLGRMDKAFYPSPRHLPLLQSIAIVLSLLSIV